MRRNTLFFLLLFLVTFSTKIFAQINNQSRQNFSSINFDDQINLYLNKSHKQKKIAWILLGSGAAINVIASSFSNNNQNGESIFTSIGTLAITASIPLFSAASKNKNKAQLAYFGKNVKMAVSDSMKQIYLHEAVGYYKTRSTTNFTTAIVLTAIGGGFIVAGFTRTGRDSYNSAGDVVEDLLLSPLLVVAGAAVALTSISFYIKGAHLRNTSKLILRTGRIPNPAFSSVSPSIHTGGRYVAVGIRFQL